ncbi:ATP synthase mitochondrial F1 complex assembly factor 2 [Aspergillus nanangensis]|uniref:ATP synthase mitochondrial F1 complex assembly factor 2 n=1 Tax=Aspergillus nanangensis TaxID=2582783 RepID=A0AAD4GMY6_ASPNN|nr:ATP synthase mitochondrial F1 complex assembly factor 2 [Aspergillus nanangensis]
MSVFLRPSTAVSRHIVQASTRYNASILSRHLHRTSLNSAIAHPVTAHGPPPKAPSAASEFTGRDEEQRDGRSIQQEERQTQPKETSVLRKRFWKNVHIQKQKSEGDYQILLDTRPLRTPSKTVLSVPPTKPQLAHAIALEWDVMTTAQQALKNHLIPLTSLTSRAADIAQEDAQGNTKTRDQIVTTAMRYLDTDTLLCWEPEKKAYAAEERDEGDDKPESLREAQIRVASDIIAFLSTKSQVTKDIIKQWIESLPAYDLAALERGIFAAKSLLVSVRLVTEWSDNFRHIQRPGQRKFGIEEAAEASNLEVKWQTDMWGEVEDTHDVNKEDLKRQLGSVIVLVSGEAKHKRSRSALALAILHRDKSKEGPEESVGRDSTGSLEPTSSSPVNSSSLLPSISPHRRSSSRRKPRQDVATPPMSAEAPLEPIGSNQSGDISVEKAATAMQIDDANMSLEQSVRTFRLFEILRSGDTTAISKAIKETTEPHGANSLSGTTLLHLAIQCAEPQVVEYIISAGNDPDMNARDKDGNTPLHLAAQLGRGPLVRELLNRPLLNDSIVNYRGQTALDVARNPDIFQQLQLARSLFIDNKTQEIQALVAQGDYEKLEKVLEEPRVEGIMDVNSLDLVTDPVTTQSGGTLLHEGARKKDTRLLQILLMHGADPFRRDKKGKLPQDVTKDDKTRAIVKKSPAAVIAQRGIQEKAILGTNSAQGVSGRSGSGEASFAAKDSREMRGYLKKWTNYTSGYKLRWFVLEDGVLSYYKHQGSKSCL